MAQNALPGFQISEKDISETCLSHLNPTATLPLSRGNSMNTVLAPEVGVFSTKHPNGYNLSLIEFDGRMVMAYRYHPNPSHWRTQLVIEFDTETLPIVMPDRYKEYSHEDPRLFIYNNKLHLSCTISRTRIQGQSVDPCVQIFGELVRGKKSWTFAYWRQPLFGKNDMTAAEKNWVFFEHEHRLFASYKTSPAHTVIEMGMGNEIARSWKTPSPECPFGDYRGGTQSFPFQGNLLRFVHVVKNNKEAKIYWHYYLAAIVFESKPPFRVLKVSQDPILTGNEEYDQCPHYKPNIIICYGAIKSKDGWKVSCGKNDCSSVIVNVTEADLNL